VIDLWTEAVHNHNPLFLSSVTVGELRRGVDLIRHRGDLPQAVLLELWLEQVLQNFSDRVLALDSDAAELWGHLRVPDPNHAIDKHIAAIGVRLLNPFRGA
jgi:predicted nucleic acid-binding protein